MSESASESSGPFSVTTNRKLREGCTTVQLGDTTVRSTWSSESPPVSASKSKTYRPSPGEPATHHCFSV